MIYYLIIFTMLLAGLANAIMDELASPDNFAGSWLSRFKSRWFNDRLTTSVNKYKNEDPAQGEAFLFSTTLLVAFTDAWHFFKEVKLICLSVAIALAGADWILFFIARLSFGFSFTSIYSFFNQTFYIMTTIKKLNAWLADFRRGRLLLAALLMLLVAALAFFSEAVDKLDPRYDPAAPDVTYLGDILVALGIIGFIVFLIVNNFRKPKRIST